MSATVESWPTDRQGAPGVRHEMAAELLEGHFVDGRRLRRGVRQRLREDYGYSPIFLLLINILIKLVIDILLDRFAGIFAED